MNREKLNRRDFIKQSAVASMVNRSTKHQKPIISDRNKDNVKAD